LLAILLLLFGTTIWSEHLGLGNARAGFNLFQKWGI